MGPPAPDAVRRLVDARDITAKAGTVPQRAAAGDASATRRAKRGLSLRRALCDSQGLSPLRLRKAARVAPWTCPLRDCPRLSPWHWLASQASPTTRSTSPATAKKNDPRRVPERPSLSIHHSDLAFAAPAKQRVVRTSPDSFFTALGWDTDNRQGLSEFPIMASLVHSSWSLDLGIEDRTQEPRTRNR